jgi:acyl-CoA thioesterase-2
VTPSPRSPTRSLTEINGALTAARLRSRPVGDLADDTAVLGGNGEYHATISGDWEIWGPMGGYVAAVALRAAAAEAPPGLEPASFTCQFLSPARFEVVDIGVTVRRASRRTAAIDVRIEQNGAAVLDAQVWFAAPGDVVRHDHAKRHRHGHPDDHAPFSDYDDNDGPNFPFWNNFDGKPLYWVEDWDSFPGDEPEWAQWVKFVPTSSFADPVLEAARLVLLADLPSFPAAVRAHPGPRTFVSPSLDLAVQFQRLNDLGDWLLVQGVTPIADRGLMAFRSEVWTADGRQAASGSGQLLLRAVQ